MAPFNFFLAGRGGGGGAFPTSHEVTFCDFSTPGTRGVVSRLPGPRDPLCLLPLGSGARASVPAARPEPGVSREHLRGSSATRTSEQAARTRRRGQISSYAAFLITSSLSVLTTTRKRPAPLTGSRGSGPLAVRGPACLEGEGQDEARLRGLRNRSPTVSSCGLAIPQKAERCSQTHPFISGVAFSPTRCASVYLFHVKGTFSETPRQNCL